MIKLNIINITEISYIIVDLNSNKSISIIYIMIKIIFNTIFKI